MGFFLLTDSVKDTTQLKGTQSLAKVLINTAVKQTQLSNLDTLITVITHDQNVIRTTSRLKI